MGRGGGVVKRLEAGNSEVVRRVVRLIRDGGWERVVGVGSDEGRKRRGKGRSSRADR